MDTLTVLREARAIIEDDSRWTNDQYICGDGSCCVAGAVVLAAGYEDFSGFFFTDGGADPVVRGALVSLHHAAVEQLGDPHYGPEFGCSALGTISVANKSPSAGLALFDRAIAAEEAKLPKPTAILNRPARRRESNCDKGLVVV